MSEAVFQLFSWQIHNYPILAVAVNLSLLVVPWAIVKILQKWHQRREFKHFFFKVMGAALAILWLVFFPNTAYIITDVRHLVDYCPPASPYNACLAGANFILFFFSYALVGWIAFVLFLNQMRQLASRCWGKGAALLIVLAVIPLTSLGVLLGLLQRWHSWEALIFAPLLWQDIKLYFSAHPYFMTWLFYTIGLGALYGAGNWLFGNKLWK
ncbi:DUF1361 domain-containing protein [Candidatus Parcubacteria bacterium]|nr:MAG: DUF1361 domain-containing protein [Candidatus Parcubacteria bacterium]